MLYYIYDGSFEGLLTAVYEAYYRREQPQGILRQAHLQQGLFDTFTNIKTDEEKSSKVYKSIREKISGLALRNCYYVYLSEIEDSGSWIYEYLRLGFKMGRKVDQFLADDRVLRVANLSRSVFGENHRLLGLLRFKLVDEGLYYAAFQPDYNIIGIVAPHFVRRMSDQNWIIHDIKRGLAAVYDKSEWFITDAEKTDLFKPNSIENSYQSLWKGYFKHIAIENRINPKLQRKNMPARYWKHLVEMELD